MSPHPVFLGVRARRALARTVFRRAVVAGGSPSSPGWSSSRWSHPPRRPASAGARPAGGGRHPRPVSRRRRRRLGASRCAACPRRRWPAGALAEPPSGSVVRQPVAAGEPLVPPTAGARGSDGRGRARCRPGTGRWRSRSVRWPPRRSRSATWWTCSRSVPAVGGRNGRRRDRRTSPAFPLVEAAVVVDVGEQADRRRRSRGRRTPRGVGARQRIGRARPGRRLISGTSWRGSAGSGLRP